jgi:hypothetical protein
MITLKTASIVILLRTGTSHAAGQQPNSLDHAIQKASLANAEGFDFSWGFKGGSSNRSLSEIRKTVRRLAIHDCHVGNGTELLLGLNYHKSERHRKSKSGPKSASNVRVFHGMSFLNLLRNRTLTIVGDSLGMQLWQGLLVDLDPHLTMNHSETYYGNGSHLFYEYFSGRPQQVDPPAFLAGSRFYGITNTTVKWCRAGVFGIYGMMHEPLAHFCLKDALFDTAGKVKRGREWRQQSKLHGPTDYLLIAAGAWYKPMSIPKFTYTKELAMRLRSQYIDDICRLRRLIDMYRPKGTRIIWRLSTHAGPIDELNSAGYPRRSFPGHEEMKAWDDPDSNALWVPIYNDVLRTLADMHGDLVLVSEYWLSKWCGMITSR